MTNFLEHDIQQCIKVLSVGGVILYPTDTVWGLGCDATNEKAVAKIYAIKQRVESKSMIALIADEMDLMHYVAAPPMDIQEILEPYADKPTSIVYNNALLIADNALAEDGSMGFRICKETFCYALLKRLRKSIIATSANISGEHCPCTFAEITEYIKSSVDYCVQFRQNDATVSSPSRIIKWTEEGITLIRE
jgi:L-threonylcarbamoyladenylate synthase